MKSDSARCSKAGVARTGEVERSRAMASEAKQAGQGGARPGEV